MTDKELVLRKIAVLREHLARVSRRRPEALDVLRADVDLQDALAMSLFVALQEAIDVAFHISADEGWGLPASNAESFATLAKHAVLEETLAEELGKTARLRNRIAHGYTSIDVERLWRELPDGLAQLERFATHIAKWIAVT